MPIGQAPAIVVSATAGYSNLGDEAMLSETLRLLRESGVHAVSVLSDDPSATRALHDVAAVPSFYHAFRLRYGYVWRRHHRLLLPIYLARLVRNASRLRPGSPASAVDSVDRSVLDTIANGDAFLVIGGGGFNDLWPFHGIYARGAEIVAAKYLDKPVFIGAQQLGPICHPTSRWLLSYVLRGTLLTLRDFGVSQAEVVNRLLLPGTPVIETLDDAFHLPPTAPSACRSLLDADGIDLKRLAPEDAVAAVCVRGWWQRTNQRPDLRVALRGIVTSLVDYDFGVLFLPMSLSKGAVADDIASAEMIIRDAGLAGHPRVGIVRRVATGSDVKGVLGLSNVALSTTYHFSLFALTMGTPAAGLYQDDYYRMKFTGLSRAFGESAPAYDVRRATASEITSRLVRLSAGARAMLVSDPGRPAEALVAARAAVAAIRARRRQ